MVKITMFRNRLRPIRLRRARGYAMVMVKNRLTMVPTTVMYIETPMLLMMESVEKMNW
ncbi:hypothetical protein D3C81_2170060 [compost metagenome]